MAYCAWCGVQVEPGHLNCPLCSGDLSEGERPTLPASQAFAREHEAVSSPEDLLKRRLGMAAAVLGAVLVLLGVAGVFRSHARRQPAAVQMPKSAGAEPGS